MIAPPRTTQPVTDHTAPNKVEFDFGAPRPRDLQDLDVVSLPDKIKKNDLDKPVQKTEIWTDNSTPDQGTLIPSEPGLHIVSLSRLIDHTRQGSKNKSGKAVEATDTKKAPFQRFYIHVSYLIRVDEKGKPTIVGLVKNDRTDGKRNQKTYAITSYNKQFTMFDAQMEVFDNGILTVHGQHTDIPVTLAPIFKKTNLGFTLSLESCRFNRPNIRSLNRTVVSQSESHQGRRRRQRKKPQPLPKPRIPTNVELVQEHKRKKETAAKESELSYFKQVESILKRNPFFYKQLSPLRSQFFATEVDIFDLSQFENVEYSVDWSDVLKGLFSNTQPSLVWTQRTVKGFNMENLQDHHKSLIRSGYKNLILTDQHKFGDNLVDVYKQDDVFIFILRDLHDPFKIKQVRLCANNVVLSDVEVSQVSDIITLQFHNSRTRAKSTFCYRPQHNDLVENSDHGAFVRTIEQAKPFRLAPTKTLRQPRTTSPAQTKKRLRFKNFRTRKNVVFRR